jgi:hypothetical protein
VTFSDSGRIPTRLIVVQLVILAFIAGIFAFVKIYSPRMEKAREAERLATRDSRLQDYFNSMVAEDYGHMVETGSGRRHPQTLKSTPPVQDVEQTLGAPDKSTTDFAGGLHLTWTGTGHTLEGSFTKGKLYCLSLRDDSTGHGASVYESSANFQAF